MAITSNQRQDAYSALAFADDLRAAYDQLSTMQAKIARYAAAVAAIQAGTADDREMRFAAIVTTLIGQGDLTRIGALLPQITALTALLETDYADFISPGG